MRQSEITAWQNEFAAFHDRFSGLFARPETREQSAKYLRGLVSRTERKNGWQMAEAVGDQTPDKTQRLLYKASWDDDRARDELQDYVREELGDPEAIGIVDETGFLKKGTKSAGVNRQYTGTAGKKENCQIGTFLAYASGRGHALIDRRLYLPESWIGDQQRRAEAKIPEAARFQTKPEQAREMLESAWQRGVPMRWVTGDEVYGNVPKLRDSVAKHGHEYVFAVASNTWVWTERPKTQAPTQNTRGRPQQRIQYSDRTPTHRKVREIVAGMGEDAWRRLALGEGSKGLIQYDWAIMRVVERVDELPGRDAWLLARRSISDPTEIAYYLSNADAGARIETLASVASQRYRIEQCFEEAKGETGLDHYEVRHWHSWYRHITLSMMAHSLLVVTRAHANGRVPAPKKRAGGA